MEKQAKIFVTGHQGMAGSAILRKLKESGYPNLVVRTIHELDLRDQLAVRKFFESEKPDYVFLAAESHGGIHANNVKRAEFIYDNLMIQSNVINQSYLSKVKKLMNIASSFVYGGNYNTPVKEDRLLKGEFDATYLSYAVSKVAGIKMCEAYHQQYGCNFTSVIVPELYDEYDTYVSVFTPVLPSLVQRIYNAKRHEEEGVEVWGTGTSKREFLHSEDLASACIFLMNEDGIDEIINIGPGEVLSIQELASLIKKYMEYPGSLYFNPAKPDTQASIILDCSGINRLGWAPQKRLRDGLKEVCQQFEHDQYSMFHRQPSTRVLDV